MRHRTWQRLATISVLLIGVATAKQAAAVQTVLYHGGPVLSPRIVCLLWGTWSDNDKASTEQYLRGVQLYLSNHDFSNGGAEPSVRQYGTWGATFSGSCVRDTVIPLSLNPTFNGNPQTAVGPVFSTDTRSQGFANAVNTEISRAQNSLGLEGYTPESVVLVFTKGLRTSSDFGSGTGKWGCGWHTSFASGPSGQYYGVVPDQNASCTTFLGLSTTGALQVLASHELFEAATDTDLSSGWYGSGGTGQEVADGCWFDTLTLPNGMSAEVAQVFDNIAQNCLTFSPAQVPPVSVVKTGTGTINVVTQDTAGTPKVIVGDGSTWNAPLPLNGTIIDPPTAVSLDGRTIDVLARGTDGGLWRWYFDGTSWAGAFPVGGIIVGPPSAVSKTSRGVNMVYVRGTDGVVYWAQGTGSNWQWFSFPMPSGVLAVSPPQALAQTSDCYDVFFTGTNGHLYQAVNCSDTPLLSWNDLGATFVNRVAVSSRPSDSNRFDLFAVGPVGSSGAAPFWEKIATPRGAWTPLGGIVVGVPSVVDTGTTTMRAFARGSGGRSGAGLYLDTSDTGSTWLGWGQLDTLLISSAPLAFTPDNTVTNVFMRRQDGRLVQKRHNGSAWQAVQDLGLAVR